MSTGGEERDGKLQKEQTVNRCSGVRCGAVRCGVVLCDVVLCGAVRCGAVRCSHQSPKPAFLTVNVPALDGGERHCVGILSRERRQEREVKENKKRSTIH